MKIVFFGTPDFAVSSLEKIRSAGYDVPAVVTAPDKPAGRGRKIQQSAVKEYAVQHGLSVLQPQSLKDPEFLDKLRLIQPDVQVVVAFRMLPEVVWNLPLMGTYNVHASLLPKYRGAAPINRALMNGDTMTGVTVFKLKHEIDTGNILMQEEFPVGADMTAGELYDALKETGAELLVRSLSILEKHLSDRSEPAFFEQENTKATHAPKIFRDDRIIDFNRDARLVHNQVRGLSPYPAAFCFLRGKKSEGVQVKILKTKNTGLPKRGAAGVIETDQMDFLRVNCLNGQIEVLELQIEGKRAMQTKEFLRGYRLPEGAMFSADGEALT